MTKGGHIPKRQPNIISSWIMTHMPADVPAETLAFTGNSIVGGSKVVTDYRLT